MSFMSGKKDAFKFVAKKREREREGETGKESSQKDHFHHFCASHFDNDQSDSVSSVTLSFLIISALSFLLLSFFCSPFYFASFCLKLFFIFSSFSFFLSSSVMTFVLDKSSFLPMMCEGDSFSLSLFPPFVLASVRVIIYANFSMFSVTFHSFCISFTFPL